MTPSAKRSVPWLGLAACIALAACQQEATPETGGEALATPARPEAAPSVTPSLAPEDRAFLIAAAERSIGALEASRIVSERARNPDLKALADNMREAQSAANEALHRLATDRQVELPTRSNDAQRQRVRELRQGGQPERAFLEEFALKGQRETIALYQREARTGADARIKAFAAESLPVLQGQLELAMQIERNDRP